MKRYRIMGFDLDSRVNTMTLEIESDWEDSIKQQWENNKKIVINSYIDQFGNWNFQQKSNNLVALGMKQISFISFHNKFYEQIRNSFVIGSYYSALTGCCALGERILNHLILKLRCDFKTTAEYKKIYRSKSFDNWDVAIDVLDSWKILLPEAVLKFKEFKMIRNHAIHFNPEVDTSDRELALNAIKILGEIINCQFGIGTQPWFFWVPGEIYIKKEYEQHPFVKNIIIPNNSFYVGYNHKIDRLIPSGIEYSDYDYEDDEITDEEFIKRRKNATTSNTEPA